MLSCLSPNGNNISFSQGPPTTLFIGTVEGVYLMERKGDSTWKTSARSIPELHVHALVFEPSSGFLFAGIYQGTVYASADLGRQWERRDKGITQRDVYCLNYVQVNGHARLYVGTEPAHLFFSDDLGISWKELSSLRSVSNVDSWDYPAPPHIAHVKYVTFDPSNRETIYVCIEQGALLRSRNGGSSWEELQGFDKDVHRLSILESDSRKMYMASGVGIYYTKDGGVTWEHLTTSSSRIGYPDAMIVHPNRENLIFIAGSAILPPLWSKMGTADTRIGRSRDGGRTWDFTARGLPGHVKGNIEAMAICVWDDSFSLFAGTTDGDIYCSEDEGEKWTMIATGLAPVAKRKHHLNFGRWPP